MVDFSSMFATGDASLKVVIQGEDQFSPQFAKASASINSLESHVHKGAQGIQGALHRTERVVQSLGGAFGRIAGGFGMGAGLVLGGLVLLGRTIYKTMNEATQALRDVEKTSQTTFLSFGSYTDEVIQKGRELNEQLRDRNRMLVEAKALSATGLLEQFKDYLARVQLESAVRQRVQRELFAERGPFAVDFGKEMETRVARELNKIEGDTARFKERVQFAESHIANFARQKVNLEKQLAAALKESTPDVEKILELEKGIVEWTQIRNELTLEGGRAVDALANSMDKVKEKTKQSASEFDKLTKKAERISQALSRMPGGLSEAQGRYIRDNPEDAGSVFLDAIRANNGATTAASGSKNVTVTVSINSGGPAYDAEELAREIKRQLAVI